MNLIPNWKATARGAWSMWAFYAAIVLELIQGLLPYVEPGSDLSLVLQAITIAILAIGSIGRLFQQRGSANV